MAHQHSSGQSVRRSTRQKSSKKDVDFLYSELPGQWQDFKFLDEEFLQPAITKQRAAEEDRGSPSSHRASSAAADPIRPSSTGDLELEICLTEAQNQKLALELEVLRLRRADGADGSADVNTENSGMQPTSEKTCKKRTVDWPHEFAPGNFSSVDYDKLELPDFVGDFLLMMKSYDVPLKSAILELLELLMAKAPSYLWSSVRSFQLSICIYPFSIHCLRHYHLIILDSAGAHQDLMSCQFLHLLSEINHYFIYPVYTVFDKGNLCKL